MFRTLGISKMYLNFNKQLISIRESDRVQLSDFVLYLPCSLQYFAGCNFKKSKLQSSDYFYFRPGSDACRAWYKVCCTCIFIRVLFPFIDQGWFLLNVIKSFHFVTKWGVQYVWCRLHNNRNSITQTLSWQFVFPLCGELFCSLYFIMWWILWVRLILLSAGFIITLVWSKQLMMKVFTNFCLRDKRIHLVFLIFSSSSVESWAFIWNYQNMVEFSDC